MRNRLLAVSMVLIALIGGAVAAGRLTNADIAPAAAIAVNKLAALTASRAACTDASGFMTVCTPTTAEINRVAGLTSAVQTQLDAKEAAITLLGLNKGGTHTDLSATGGTSKYLKQGSVGGDIVPTRPTCSELSDAATSCSTDTTNASNLASGTVPAARLPTATYDKGGTGLTSYAAGDLIIASAVNTLAKLAASTNGFVLTLVAGLPAWVAATTAANHCDIYVDTGNGQGSTRTTTARFTNRRTTVAGGADCPNSDIVYSDSATLGGLMTAGVAGKFCFTCALTDSVNGGMHTGLALNNTSTTGIDALTWANGKRHASRVTTNNTPAPVSWCGYLAVNDVVTCMSDIASNGVTNLNSFSAMRAN